MGALSFTKKRAHLEQVRYDGESTRPQLAPRIMRGVAGRVLVVVSHHCTLTAGCSMWILRCFLALRMEGLWLFHRHVTSRKFCISKVIAGVRLLESLEIEEDKLHVLLPIARTYLWLLHER